MLGTGILGDIIAYSTGDGLLEVPPALVGRQVHTGKQPVGVLHVTVDTGDEGRLLEVRSVRSGIDRIDQRIIITMYIRIKIPEVLHREAMIIFNLHGLLTRIYKIALLILCQQVSLRRRLHAGRTIGLTIRAEIESL